MLFSLRATQGTGPKVKPFLVLYCQLATTVVCEMGLMRHPAEEHFTAIGKIWGKRLSPIRERTPEEMRVALSLWFLTSMWALSIQLCLKMIANHLL